jgi:hypothetical protein
MSVQQVATDAFGNALGDAVVASQQPDPQYALVSSGTRLAENGGRSSVRLGMGDDGSSIGGTGEVFQGAAMTPSSNSRNADSLPLAADNYAAPQSNMTDAILSSLASRRNGPAPNTDGMLQFAQAEQDSTGPTRATDAGVGGSDVGRFPVTSNNPYVRALQASGLPVRDRLESAIGTSTGGPATDPMDTDIERENYLLSSRTRTISSRSPSGMLSESGKSYFLINRDQNGVGIFQDGDFTEGRSVRNERMDPAAVYAIADGLQIGSRGAQVRQLQLALGVTADGVFGSRTRAAMEDFRIAGDADASLGGLSRNFESNRGVFTISSGIGDPGGVSYGAHQLATTPRTINTFIASPENAGFAEPFVGTTPGAAGFNRAYLQVAEASPVDFDRAQHSFTTRTLYDPVRAYAERRGFDVSDRGIQEALYSQSVQSGRQGNEIIINQARNTLGDVSRSSPAQQLDAIYSARTAYASQYASVSATTNRYALEFVRAQRISNYYQNYFAPR